MTEEVFIKEVDRLRKQMVEVATRYLEDCDEAEDVVQDTLLKLWTMCPMLPVPMNRIAFTILKHRCIDWIRRHEAHRKATDIDWEQLNMPDNDADELEAAKETEQRLMKAVEKLPSAQRIVLRMRYIEGNDISRIATLTGGNEQSVRKALSRARQSVLKMMTTAAACVAIMFSLGLGWKQYNDSKFDQMYEGSYMMSQGHEVSKPSAMKQQIADLLLQADLIEQQMTANENMLNEAEQRVYELMEKDNNI